MEFEDTIETRAQLHSALYEAAELEHTICCQYLFAAFSLKCRPDEGLDALELDRVRDWKSKLLLLARQEMVHLNVICNLLTVVGGEPHLARANFPMPVTHYPLDMYFDLRPFDMETLHRFIQFEQPWAPGTAPPTDSSARADRVRLPVKLSVERQTFAVRVCKVEPEARFDGEPLQCGDEILQIWDKHPLSNTVRERLEQATPDTPVPIEVLTDGRPRKVVAHPAPGWPVIDYESVSDLYSKIEEGLERLSRRRVTPLIVDVDDGQLSNESFDLPEDYVMHDMIFPRIKGMRSAQKALKLIREQGEGPLQQGGHHAVLLQLREEFQQLLDKSGGNFTPARPVVINPRTSAPPGGSLEGLLEGPALKVARLLNYANETMLMMLVRLYADEGQGDPRFARLRDVASRSLMTMVIRPVGELLTEMPAREGSSLRAGATFEIGHRIPMIQDRETAWKMFHERMTTLASWSDELVQTPGVPDRMTYIHKNLELLARNLGEQLKSR